MRKTFIAVIFAQLGLATVVSAQVDEDPRAASERVVRESQAKAAAEKARNDQIVEQQRAAEREAARRARQSTSPQSGDDSPAAVPQ